MTGAGLEAAAFCDVMEAPRTAWREAMTTIAEAGRRGYSSLVRDDPDFIHYFRSATPIDVIERLRIGSRPPSRRAGESVDDLRAIPWVFAWMQSRHLLPGWYGVGAGLAVGVERHGEELLREMAREWPFFANLLADVEMVLAKADLGIAARYAALAGERGERVFGLIRDQHATTRGLLCRLQGIDEILEREPVLARAISLRNPYVDPMSLIQVDLLRRWRASGREDDTLLRALFATVRGIARGMQNTG